MSYSATLGRVQSMGGSIPPLPQQVWTLSISSDENVLDALWMIRYGFNLGFGKGEQYRKHSRSCVENNGGSIPPLIAITVGTKPGQEGCSVTESQCLLLKYY